MGDLRARVSAFGANVLPRKPPKTYLQLVFEAASDTTLIILMVAALISFGLSFYKPDSGGGAGGGAGGASGSGGGSSQHGIHILALLGLLGSRL